MIKSASDEQQGYEAHISDRVRLEKEAGVCGGFGGAERSSNLRGVLACRIDWLPKRRNKVHSAISFATRKRVLTPLEIGEKWLLCGRVLSRVALTMYYCREILSRIEKEIPMWTGAI